MISIFLAIRLCGRDNWISELDTCVASPALVSHLCDFSVVERRDLPSDHAPITVTVESSDLDLDGLLTRAALLGDSATRYGNAGKKPLVRKPLRYNRTNRELFLRNIERAEAVDATLELNELDHNVSDVLYSCVQKSLYASRQEETRGDINLGRWKRLLKDDDDARVWKAINWGGDFSMKIPGGNVQPSDEEFKAHFESALNPAAEASLGDMDVTNNVTIPILDEPISLEQVN